MVLLVFIINMVMSALKWLKNNLYTHIQKIKWFTGPLQTSMMDFTWVWESRFSVKFDSFFNILKKIRKLENYKKTYVQAQRSSKTDKNFLRVGWVIIEKIGFYNFFLFKRWCLFLQNMEAASASRSRGCRYWQEGKNYAK